MIFTDNLLRKQDKFIIKKNEKMKINNAQITLNRFFEFFCFCEFPQIYKLRKKHQILQVIV